MATRANVLVVDETTSLTPASPTRVLFACSGVGVMNRGIETFFRDAFDGLKGTPGLHLRLLKGGGKPVVDEQNVWCLPRTGLPAMFLGKLARRNGYVIEQWTSFPSVVRQVRAFRPHVVFYSDANLGFLLFWLRKYIGVPYVLLFSNGGPVHPPFVRTDYVQQVAPFYYQEALRAGESPSKHFLVPYGIQVVEPPDRQSPVEQNSLRQRLGLPADRPVILSVGWIRNFHKRMDYVIEETARLARPRPFLQLVGAMDSKSREIISLGSRMLGPDGFSAKSVSPEAVFDYYRAADCFVLASLREGFGRVYLEALMHGLPVIAHRHPVTEYVLGEIGMLADLSRPGELACLLADELRRPRAPWLTLSRWQCVRDRFGWDHLRPIYRKMFESCRRKILTGDNEGNREYTTDPSTA